jgi:unsaturated chondroitin disaccharide hydrolase
VLKHGSYHERKQLGVDESVMWGEYFFTETLARVVQQS